MKYHDGGDVEESVEVADRVRKPRPRKVPMTVFSTFHRKMSNPMKRFKVDLYHDLFMLYIMLLNIYLVLNFLVRFFH